MQAMLTAVMAGAAAVTAMLAEPEMLMNPSTAECAVQVPVPAAVGVNTPPDVMAPPVAVHVTALLNMPVPNTVAAQVDVCAVEMDAGVGATVMEVIVNGAELTVIFAEPETLV